MMEREAIIHRLWSLGHFHNPETQVGVLFADLEKLQLHDKAVIEAIKSYQAFMLADLEDYSELRHHHTAVIDGEVGPATDDLLEMPRCGFPDYPMPNTSMAMGGKQEANWPTACRGDLKTGRNFRTLPGSTEVKTHGVWWASANNWTWALEDVSITAADVNDSAVQVYADLRALGGSTLAWSYLAQNRCNVRLQQAYNTRTNWGSDAFAATVKSHEDGHAWGLPHNNDRDALMYPSIHARSQARHGYPNATDLRVAHGLGYTISNQTGPPPREWLYKPRPWGDTPDEPDVPEPDDPNPDPKAQVRGTLTIQFGDLDLGDFILVPKPRL